MNRKRRINGVVVRVPKRLLVYRDHQRKCRTWVDWRREERMAMTARFKAIYGSNDMFDLVARLMSINPFDPNWKPRPPHPSTLWEVVA